MDALPARDFALACQHCRAAGIRGEHFASDRRCAFLPDGTFTSDNWNCEGIRPLRDLTSRFKETFKYGIVATSSDDEQAALMPFVDGSFILLQWYKSRGRTADARVICSFGGGPNDIDDIPVRLLTLADVDAYLAMIAKLES